jgi:hypothetical protein
MIFGSAPSKTEAPDDFRERAVKDGTRRMIFGSAPSMTEAQDVCRERGNVDPPFSNYRKRRERWSKPNMPI